MDNTDYKRLGDIISCMHMGVTIIDRNGVFVYVGESYLHATGLLRSQIEGKSIFDKAVTDMFSPCVSELVFKHREKLTSVQRVLNSGDLFVTGVPITDDNGELSMVICYSSWEVSSYDDLYGTYSRMDTEYSAGAKIMDAAVPNGAMIYKSSKSKESMELTEIFAEAGRSVYIYGPEGAGKHFMAVSTYSKLGKVYEYSCRFREDKEIARELLGKDGVMESEKCRVLILKDIDCLSPRMQRHIIEAAVRQSIILVGLSVRPLDELRDEGHITDGFYHFFKPYQVKVCPLSERADDTKELIRYYTGLYNHMYSRNTSISPRAENLMACHNWKENINELKGVIERLVLTAKRDKINVYDLPAEISGGTRDFSEDTTLNHMMELYEGDIIREAYEKYPTSVALSKRLGISQATAVRKIHKYIGDEGDK